MVEELLISVTETFPIALKTRRRHWRVAVTRMVIESGWLPKLYVVLCGFESSV